MAHKILLKVVLLLIISSRSMAQTIENSGWRPLFNGKDLKGWDTYLGPKYDTVLKKRNTVPIGLNNDPDKVFNVVKLGDEKVIRISGEDFGGISTVDEYENYHLQLQFRWGELRWAPRKTGKKDSGLMYHAVGPHGADGGNWMRSHEFQIQEGDCGDYWACAGAVFDVKALKDQNKTYIYNENGAVFTFSIASPDGRRCIKSTNAEKPSGEWNTLDLYCFGSTSVHVVNGVVNMILHNTRQFESGKEVPLTKGKIQIQSEGAEVFYRDIKICSINKIPDNILKGQIAEK
jgi:hypothetical protein